MPSTLGRQNKPAELSAPGGVAVANENDGVLPTDVLYEVLLRLPAKELCRLRVVCRSWRSLTSDPRFVRSHASRHPPLVAGIWNNREVHLVDLSCVKNIVVRRLPAWHRIQDLSTDSSLLCVSLSAPATGFLSYVLDPVTGEVVSFQSPVLGPVPHHVSHRWTSQCLLCHVPSTGEYKALVTNGYCLKGGQDGLERVVTQMCNVVTLGSTAAGHGGDGKIRWRARPCPPPLVVGPNCLENRVVIDGVAYFLSELSNSPYSFYHDIKYFKDIEPDAIFAFDLAKEEWRPNTLRGPLSSSSACDDSELKFSRERGESLQLFVLDG